LLSYITSRLWAACNKTSVWKQLQVQCTSMLHKMVLDPENNGKVAAVHHPIAKKKNVVVWYLVWCFRTTSKWPQVSLLSHKTTSHFREGGKENFLPQSMTRTKARFVIRHNVSFYRKKSGKSNKIMLETVKVLY
jgi:hypothetical protein